MGRGRVLVDLPTGELLDRFAPGGVILRTDPDRSRGFAGLVIAAGGRIVTDHGAGELEVHGVDVETVSDLALGVGIPLRHLAARRATLEDAFLKLTQAEAEFTAAPLDRQQVRA